MVTTVNSALFNRSENAAPNKKGRCFKELNMDSKEISAVQEKLVNHIPRRG
jgi:hypothetical protein